MSIRPLSLRFTALGSASPRFTEGYDVPEGVSFVSPVDASLIDPASVVLCEHCVDAGWLRPADYVSAGSYQWDDEDKSRSFARNICTQHLVAETENFRDMA